MVVKPKLRFWVMMGLAITITLIVTACGGAKYDEANNHNAPSPTRNVDINWTRIDTPPGYHTIIFACFGKNGIYEDQADNNSVMVLKDDPHCP
jgi:hypothetical protein